MCKLSQNVSIEELLLAWQRKKAPNFFFIAKSTNLLHVFTFIHSTFFPYPNVFPFSWQLSLYVNELSRLWTIRAQLNKKLIYIYLFINKLNLNLSFSLFNK